MWSYFLISSFSPSLPLSLFLSSSHCLSACQMEDTNLTGSFHVEMAWLEVFGIPPFLCAAEWETPSSDKKKKKKSEIPCMDVCVRDWGGKRNMGVWVTDILYGEREGGGWVEKGESPALMCQNLCATLALTSWERVNGRSLVKLSCSRRALPGAAEPASLC